MKKLLAAAIGLFALGAVATSSASAAPLSGANGLAAKTETRNVIQVHGRHRACRLDRRGWHRSYHRGSRSWCRPRWKRHRHHHHRWHKRRHHHKHHHHRRHRH